MPFFKTIFVHCKCLPLLFLVSCLLAACEAKQDSLVQLPQPADRSVVLNPIPQPKNVTLSWTTPDDISSLEYLTITWTSNSSVGGSLRVQRAELKPGETSQQIIMDLNNNTDYSFSITAFYIGGVSGPFAQITVRTGENHDNDNLADSVDPDDDNDGVRDEIDNCPQGEVAWNSNRTNDADSDGCRDNDEDAELPGIANLSIIPAENDVHFSWTNPNTSLSHINISWMEEDGSSGGDNRTTDTLIPLGRVNFTITNLATNTNYTFFLQAHYPNGGTSTAAINITIGTGKNYDKDNLADRLDPDDDNDGLADLNASGSPLDLCRLSVNSSFISRNLTQSNTNDVDADGCEDLTEDSLPGVQNLRAISNYDNVTLNWLLPADDEHGSGYQAGIANILIGYTNSTDEIATDTIRGELSRAANTTTYTLNQDTLSSPQGDEYYFTVTLVYRSNYTNRSEPVISRINPDDDNDSIDDEDDTCPQGQTDWMSNSNSDTDSDGCRDRDEDEVLAGVTQLTARPAPVQVFLEWINPNVSLSHINISWMAESGSSSGDNRITDTLMPLGRANITIINLINNTDYIFTVRAHYENGGISMPPATINVRSGENYDKDNLADSLDPDDDNDGLADLNASGSPLDFCPFSINPSFVSQDLNQPYTNDIDADGCEDLTEDSLPGAQNPMAMSNYDNVTLNWMLPADDERGTGYPAGIKEILISYTNSTAETATDTIRGELSLAADATTGTLNQTQLSSPQGDEYYFTITLVYRSNYTNGSELLMSSIDPDDDDDGINDFTATGEALDLCRLSVNSSFVSRNLTQSSTNDVDADGCEDLTEDSLPGVQNLRAVSNYDNVTLNWLLPADDEHGAGYQAGIKEIIIRYTNSTDEIATDTIRGELSRAANTTTYTLNQDTLSSPQGDEYYFTVTLVYRSNYTNRSEPVISRINPDDDNDSIEDRDDTCPRGQTGWTSNSSDDSDDTDSDGCRDRDEDEVLVGVTQLTARPAPVQVFLEWINPNVSLSHINISWMAESGSSSGDNRITDTLMPLGQANITIINLINNTDYIFTVRAHYENGGISMPPATINVRSGENYDKDNLADSLDPDDDNDGIKDHTTDGNPLDICPFSINPSFVSQDLNQPHTNDIDADGCEDLTEDSLPGAQNPMAMSNHDNVTLNWLLPADDERGTGYPAGIKEILISYTNSTAETATDTIRGELSLAADATTYTLNQTQLSSPQGDEYYFIITLVYRSNYTNGSELLMSSIDPDDDDDGINDFTATGEALDLCRLSVNSSFVSRNLTQSNTNDVDADGCEDLTEDSLPGVQNLRAVSNYDNVTLNWLLPADDEHGADYPAGIANILIRYTNSTDEIATDTIRGELSRAANAITGALNQTQLSSPQGDEYYFTVTLVYRSNYINRSEPVISRINPDDDNDSIEDRDDICPRGQTGWTSNSSDDSDDTDSDGCRDRDEDEVLVGVTQLTARPAPVQVFLEWINPNVSLSHINISWMAESGSSSGDNRITDTLMPLGRANITIINLINNTDYIFTVRAHYENGGISMPPATINVRSGENYDKDNLADSLDPDDDNDEVADEEDLCPQGRIGWMSNSSDDTDGDGCRDRDEDEVLVGVTQLTARPAPVQVFLEWINPNVSLSHINISWMAESGSSSGDNRITDTLMPLGRANITIINLINNTDYIFTVQAHYENGGISMPPATINVRSGENYDKDNLADSLDPDDDNDGIKDHTTDGNPLDICPFSINPSFVSQDLNQPHTNDIDADGCEDLTEDSLPGVQNPMAMSNHDNVTLNWLLPADDERGHRLSGRY